MKLRIFLTTTLTFSLCSCRFMMGWASEAIAIDPQGKTQVVKPPKGIRQIPDRDLRFTVHRFPKRVEITMTADQWRIEGYGLGSGSELLIDSVAGVPDPKGSRRVISWDHPDGMNARIFLLGRGAGDRTEIH